MKERNSRLVLPPAGMQSHASKPASAFRQSLVSRFAVFLILCPLLAVIPANGCKSSGVADAVDDRVVVAQITRLISEDPAGSQSNVRVFAREGRVTLSGKVPDAATRVRLLALAKSVKGVRSVSGSLETPR